MAGKKIRVNKTNSKVLEGKLYISMLKAQQVKSIVLQKLIEYSNYIVYPGLGRLVEYNGPYIRVTK
jgi:hypothetical protein